MPVTSRIITFLKRGLFPHIPTSCYHLTSMPWTPKNDRKKAALSRYQLVGELTEETLMGWWGGSRYSGWVRNKKWMRLWIFVPPRERVHIPPQEKENHRLKKVPLEGVVFKDFLLLSTLTWGNEPPTSKTKHPSREVAYPIPNVLAKKRKTEQHLRRTSWVSSLR